MNITYRYKIRRNGSKKKKIKNKGLHTITNNIFFIITFTNEDYIIVNYVDYDRSWKTLFGPSKIYLPRKKLNFKGVYKVSFSDKY